MGCHRCRRSRCRQGLPDIQKVLLSVAFITESGVEKIEAQLMAHAACVTVFAGIRNDTTSYQGLIRLQGIVSKLYTVDTGSRTVIFHPKLYLARGRERARQRRRSSPFQNPGGIIPLRWAVSSRNGGRHHSVTADDIISL